MLCVNDNDYAYIMMYTLDPLLPQAVNMMQLQNEYPPLQELQAALKYWWLLNLPLV
jgi:hypothetical protein